jgi:hypothetical protein
MTIKDNNEIIFENFNNGCGDEKYLTNLSEPDAIDKIINLFTETQKQIGGKNDNTQILHNRKEKETMQQETKTQQ